MADVYSTAGVNAKKVRASNGLGPKTVIVSVAKSGGISNDNLFAIIQYLTTTHGSSGSGDDAFTVAGVSDFTAGSTETVYLALQGTGAFTAADADLGISGYAVAVVATFDQNPA